MSELQVPCPRCGQDWIQEVRLIALEQDAFLCLECDALWLDAGDIGPDSFRDYGTFMEESGRTEPHSASELVIKGPLLKR